jgi:hypothetical protein
MTEATNMRMTAMRIVVTPDDIKKGKRHNPTACPIAHAMRRAFGRRVSVEASYARVTYPDRVAVYRLPAEARRFIDCFDVGLRVEPIAFVTEYVYGGE